MQDRIKFLTANSKVEKLMEDVQVVSPFSSSQLRRPLMAMLDFADVHKLSDLSFFSTNRFYVNLRAGEPPFFEPGGVLNGDERLKGRILQYPYLAHAAFFPKAVMEMDRDLLLASDLVEVLSVVGQDSLGNLKGGYVRFVVQE